MVIIVTDYFLPAVDNAMSLKYSSTAVDFVYASSFMECKWLGFDLAHNLITQKRWIAYFKSNMRQSTILAGQITVSSGSTILLKKR